MTNLPSYYIIRPKDVLRNDPRMANAEWKCLIDRTFLWSRNEDGRAIYGIETAASRAMQMKLLFLLDIKNEYLPPGGPKNDFQEFVAEIVGYHDLNVGTFDENWTLERVDSMELDYEEAIDDITDQDLDAHAAPEDGSLSDWFAWLRSRRDGRD